MLHTLLLVAAVALPLALAGLSAWSSWRTAWHEAEADMRRDAASAAEYAGRVLNGYRQVAERIADLLRDFPEAEIAQRRPALERTLGAILATLPELEAAAAIGPHGRLLLGAPAAGGEALGRDAGLLAALNASPGPEPMVAPLPPRFGAGGGAFAILLHGTDAPGGLVALAVQARVLAAGLAMLGADGTDAFALRRADGSLIARSETRETAQPAHGALPDDRLAGAMRAGVERGAWNSPAQPDHAEQMVAFRRVLGWPVYAVVARPIATVAAQWHAAIRLPMLLGLASSGLLAALGLMVRRHQAAIAAANSRLEQRAAERTVEVAQALAAQRAGDARLRLAIDAAGFGTWEMDLRQGQLTRSGLLIPERPDLPLRGFTLDAHLGLVHPQDRPQLLAAFQRLVSGEVDHDRATYRIEGPDGRWFWMESYGGVVERDPVTLRPVKLAGVSRDISEHRLAEAALRASETRLRVAMDAARFSTWEYDVLADRGTRRGALTASVPQVPPSDVTLKAWLAEIHPEDRPAAEAALRGLIDGTHERIMIEFRVRQADGDWISVESAGAVAERDPHSGAVLRLAGVARDVTEQRMAAHRQALLAREVDHRAKNALAVVQAALRLTPKTDAESYAQAVEGRVRALARAHTLLADARWEGASLQVLAMAELAAFLPAAPGGVPARASTEGPELRLAPAAAQALSMALHELATNATKYGALSDQRGRVTLRWEVDQANDILRLSWTERGGPPIATPPDRRGFGSRVVEATVRDQLGGRLLRHWEPEGLTCILEIPLARALAATAPRGRVGG